MSGNDRWDELEHSTFYAKMEISCETHVFSLYMLIKMEKKEKFCGISLVLHWEELLSFRYHGY
jgi:hypothetical protein